MTDGPIFRHVLYIMYCEHVSGMIPSLLLNALAGLFLVFIHFKLELLTQFSASITKHISNHEN